MDRAVEWEFTWESSRLVRWSGVAAGGAAFGLIGAALLARVAAPLTTAAIALAAGSLFAAAYGRRAAAEGYGRRAAVSRALAMGAPAALALYALALRGRLVAVLSILGALQFTLAAGTVAVALRSSGRVDPDAGTLSYGSPASQVTVRLDRANGAYALRFRQRALLALTYRDGGVLLDPSTPALVLVSRDAAGEARRIVRS